MVNLTDSNLMYRSNKMKKNRDYLEIMQIACDEICKYVGKLEQEELEKQCENCPLAINLNSKLKRL